MSIRLFFFLILSHMISAQKVDTNKYLQHQSRLNEILKNKNDKINAYKLYEELAQMAHSNPKINLYQFLEEKNVKNCEKNAIDSSNIFVFSHLNLALGNSTFMQKGPIVPLNYFLKCEKAFVKIKDINCQVFCLLRISSIYSHNAKASLELNYINKAINIAKKSNDSQLIAQSLGYYGAYFLDNNQYKTALEVFEDIVKLKDTNPRNEKINKFNIGKCYLNMGQKNKGIQIFETTLSELPQNDFSYTDYQIYIRSELIKLYLQSNNTDRIKFHFSKMKFYATSPQINQYELRWFKNSEYLVQKALGNYKVALEKLEQLKKKDDTLISTQLDQQLDAIKAELGAKEKSSLAEYANLRSKQEKENQLKWFLIIISLLCCFSTVYVAYTNKILKANNSILKVKNKEISEALLKGQTIERQRVALDLHDNLGSTLSALWLSLDSVNQTKMNLEEKAIHQNLRKNLEKAYNDVRLLSHNLLPEEFEKQGLTNILQGFVRKMNKSSTIKFELKIDDDFGRVDNKIEFELYSICLELVNNIIKHSKAAEAKIELSRSEKQIELKVSDNGIGTFKNESDGKGMKNVKARVESLNGKWELLNIENQGVTNTITVDC